MITCVGLNPAIDRVLEAPGFAVGQHCRARLVRSRPAGKAVNIARVLGLLGRRVRLTGFVGEAELAAYRESFEGLPVEVDLTPVEAPTRCNTTILDPENGTETHIREHGHPLGIRELEAFADDFIRNADIVPEHWVVFAGSLPDGVDPGVIAGIIREIALEDLRVAVDASGPILTHLRDVPLDLLTPNRPELAELLGGLPQDEASIGAAARAAVAQGRGAAALLVSDGARGAGLFTREAAWWGVPPGGEPASTVGAGDALLAGYLAAEVRGLPPETCLRRAVGVARSAIDSRFAGEVDPEAVERYLADITIESLG